MGADRASMQEQAIGLILFPCTGSSAPSLSEGLRACCAVAGAVLADVALIWANCRQYNEPNSELLPLCTEAEADFGQRWAAAGLPTGACALLISHALHSLL